MLSSEPRRRKARVCGSICVGLSVLVPVIVVLASIVELGPDEQLLVKDPRGWYVKNGPWRGVHVTGEKKEIRKATVLSPEQFAVVEEKLTGELRLIQGPHLLFLGPNDKLARVGSYIVLHKDEYVVIRNERTGDPRTEEGPQLLQLGIYDEVLRKAPKVVLQEDEYIRLVDQVTGAERVLRGPRTFAPEPLELMPQGVQRSVFLDTESAVRVMNRETGMQRLVTEHGAFAPGSYEEVVEVQRLIKVMPHEAVIVRDQEGRLTVHGNAGNPGSSVGTSFFLPPYCELVEMWWSAHSDKPQLNQNSTVRKVPVTRIDLRSKKMFFKFEVRTSDNVKLVLEGTIFWRVEDVAKMVNATSDPEGDVWHHARSALIEAVSNRTLSHFMSHYSSFVREAFEHNTQTEFYRERGVRVDSLEVTSFDCVDAKTAEVLQEIIQETTNRINRLTAQQSENEVQAAKLAMEIELARRRTELIETRSKNDALMKTEEGEADGAKRMKGASTFIGLLEETLPDLDRRVELYKMHELQNASNTDTHNLASGNAHLFLTPEDLRLKLQLGRESNPLEL